MALFGIGTDIVEVERIAKAAKESFINRFFTAYEKELFEARGMKPQTIAANFAAKEAFVKALGTGFFGVSPAEIEVLRDSAGKPYINVFGKAKEHVESCGVKRIHVSISHEKSYATAFVILE